jgi:hypothetical protein
MLPQVMPMLAVAAKPFDAPEYCFEIKYDGVRALAAVDQMGWRLWGRERADYTTRYPELDVLRRLPTGTLVDGELVALDAEGRPDLRGLLRRHGLSDPWRIRQARQWFCRLIPTHGFAGVTGFSGSSRGRTIFAVPRISQLPDSLTLLWSSGSPTSQRSVARKTSALPPSEKEPLYLPPV